MFSFRWHQRVGKSIQIVLSGLKNRIICLDSFTSHSGDFCEETYKLATTCKATLFNQISSNSLSPSAPPWPFCHTVAKVLMSSNISPTSCEIPAFAIHQG